MPRRPARPAICWNSLGISSRRRRPSHLLIRPITTDARRHVDAQRQRVGGEDDLHQPAREEHLDQLLEDRQQPGVVEADALARPAR